MKAKLATRRVGKANKGMIAVSIPKTSFVPSVASAAAGAIEAATAATFARSDLNDIEGAAFGKQ